MKPGLIILCVMTTACTPARVTHPTKTAAQMQADIDLCTREANNRY